MTPDDIETMLPHPQPISTIGPTMTLDEQAAREKTLQTVLNTILNEADHLMKHEGRRAYEQAISQAWEYTNAMITRGATGNRGKANRPDTDLLEACIIAQETIGTREEEYIEAAGQTLSDELTEDQETDGIAHGAAVALLGAHAALREHVRGIARSDEMSKGHAQAAVGLNMTIEHLTETLELQHNEHCHHCDTIDRAYEGADAAQTLLTAMRPAIRELTQVQLHPSLLQDAETQAEAQGLAESTIDLLASFQLLLNGDPSNPETSLHCFYLDGTLHVKRLTDPFPKGMHSQGASAVIATTGALATAHAQDHAVGFADPVAKWASEMELVAECGLHDVTTEEINHYLETVVLTTPHPTTQAEAVTALTGDRTMAERLMARRPDLFQPATPAQREQVMDAVRTASLQPEMEDLINGLLSKGPAALNQRPEPPPIGEVIHLMQVATTLTQDEMTIADIAESLGRPTYKDPIISTWVDQFIEDSM